VTQAFLERFAARKASRFSQAVDIVAARSIGLSLLRFQLPVKITTAEDCVAVKRSSGKMPFTARLSQNPLLFYAALPANNDFSDKRAVNRECVARPL
jgi:hypothetical protein